MTDDGRHEGYLIELFADGERGNGTTGDDIGDAQVAVGDGVRGDDDTWINPTRPASEVTGWVVCCDCRTTNSFRPTTWAEPVFTWVSSAELEDLAGRRAVCA